MRGLDSLHLDEIHGQGALDNGIASVEACVRGLWALADGASN